MKYSWGAVLVLAGACVREAAPPPAAVAAPQAQTAPGAAPMAGSDGSPAIGTTVAAASSSTPSAPPAPPAPPPAAEQPAPPPDSAPSVDRALAAASDPTRLHTESAFIRAAEANTSCLAGGQQLPCIKLAEGPLVVTDYETLPGCTLSLRLGAQQADAPTEATPVELQWLVSVGAPATHGARLFVPEGAQLHAVMPGKASPPAATAPCTLTWSGFRPRALPPPRSKTAPDNPYR